MDTRISGIPCQVDVTTYQRYRPARLHGHPDTWAPPEYEEINFSVFDRRGRLAPWLERKMTEADRKRIINEFRNYWND
ncbi:MAG: hypothetical protein KA204_00210 [Chromatiaceae bacterium]|nr:hypothetical protein [Chromatiaceae bacterium]